MYLNPVGSFGNIALARRNDAIAESVLFACHAATPALNVGTHATRRHVAMSSLQSGFSASAWTNAVSAPCASFTRM